MILIDRKISQMLYSRFGDSQYSFNFFRFFDFNFCFVREWWDHSNSTTVCFDTLSNASIISKLSPLSLIFRLPL
jgi:hypothetical protein